MKQGWKKDYVYLNPLYVKADVVVWYYVYLNPPYVKADVIVRFYVYLDSLYVKVNAVVRNYVYLNPANVKVDVVVRVLELWLRLVVTSVFLIYMYVNSVLFY